METIALGVDSEFEIFFGTGFLVLVLRPKIRYFKVYSKFDRFIPVLKYNDESVSICKGSVTKFVAAGKWLFTQS